MARKRVWPRRGRARDITVVLRAVGAFTCYYSYVGVRSDMAVGGGRRYHDGRGWRSTCMENSVIETPLVSVEFPWSPQDSLWNRHHSKVRMDVPSGKLDHLLRKQEYANRYLC